MAKFRPGIGMLVKQSRVPVLPMAMRGLGDLKARGSGWFRSGRLKCASVSHPLRTVGFRTGHHRAAPGRVGKLLEDREYPRSQLFPHRQIEQSSTFDDAYSHPAGWIESCNPQCVRRDRFTSPEKADAIHPVFSACPSSTCSCSSFTYRMSSSPARPAKLLFQLFTSRRITVSPNGLKRNASTAPSATCIPPHRRRRSGSAHVPGPPCATRQHSCAQSRQRGVQFNPTTA